MKRFRRIIILTLFLIIPLSMRAQNSINLTILAGLNTIDFAAFTFTNNLSGSPRIFRVDIQTTPPGKQVMVGGQLTWKKNESSGFVNLVNDFKTKQFAAVSFFNDELGNGTILLDHVDANNSVVTENFKMGKPTGIYGIKLYLYDQNNNQIGTTYQEISFLNPAPTISILSPQENSSFDVGNVQAQWTPVQGAAYYTVRANALQTASQSAEEALNAGNPLINDKDVGKIETVNLGTLLDRQWVGGQRIALAVTAFVIGPGGGNSLRSTPVIFNLNESGKNSNSLINPDLVRLGKLLLNRVNQDFVNKLLNGQIPVEQIQFTDEKNATISFSDFLNILSFWEMHSESIISVNYQAK